MQNSHSPTTGLGREIWIVGPGAVGGLFLANLVQKNQIKTVTFGRSSGFQELMVEYEGRVFAAEADVVGPEQRIAARPVEVVDCYLNVHTPELTSAIKTSQRFLSEAKAPKVRFIVCSNGIVRREHIDLMMNTQNLQTTCYRAVLYFGARRDAENPPTYRIRHLGGKRIVYGTLAGIADNSFQPQQDLDWFSWEDSPHIQIIEREKFFMNLLLALYIGPRLLQNANLLEQISRQDYEQWLKSYVEITRPESRSSEELDRSFRTLLADTKQNTNSFSLKWHAGELQVIWQLIDDLRYLLSAAKNTEANYVAAGFIKQKVNAQLQTFGLEAVLL